MHVQELLEELRARGVELVAAGDRLRYRPVDAVPEELVAALRAHKAALLALLRQPSPACAGAELADALDTILRLGQRLQRGEISALRCGLTGRICRHCQGIPCWGSRPWEEEGGRTATG